MTRDRPGPPRIEATELTKLYLHPVRAPVAAVRGITLTLEPGVRAALVGPNGAGKSTFLRLVLGAAHPTRGRLTVAGLPPRMYARAAGVGYVPDRCPFPSGWTVEQALAWGLVLDRRLAERDRHLRRWGLEPWAAAPVGRLSAGLRQRLMLAQAFASDRDLFLLDEPTTALDPPGRALVRRRLRAWRRRHPDGVLLLATQDLGFAAAVAERLLLLDAGALRATVAAPPRGALRIVLPSADAAQTLRAYLPEAQPDARPTVLLVPPPARSRVWDALAAWLHAGGELRALGPARPTWRDLGFGLRTP